MKSYIKIKFIAVLFVFLFTLIGYAQTPTYQAVLANDTLVSSTIYEFDIYLLSTDTTVFQLGGCQIGLTFDNSWLNGGELTAIIIPGTCEFSNSAQAPSNLDHLSIVDTKRVLKLLSKTPPGKGNGSIISNSAPGTRVGRFRLTNSVPFMLQATNMEWSFDEFVTKIAAYIGGINTLITNPSSHLNNLSNFPTPEEAKH